MMIGLQAMMAIVAATEDRGCGTKKAAMPRTISAEAWPQIAART